MCMWRPGFATPPATQFIIIITTTKDTRMQRWQRRAVLREHIRQKFVVRTMDLSNEMGFTGELACIVWRSIVENRLWYSDSKIKNDKVFYSEKGVLLLLLLSQCCCFHNTAAAAASAIKLYTRIRLWSNVVKRWQHAHCAWPWFWFFCSGNHLPICMRYITSHGT